MFNNFRSFINSFNYSAQVGGDRNFDLIVDQFLVFLRRNNINHVIYHNMADTGFTFKFEDIRPFPDTVDKFTCIKTYMNERGGPRYHMFVKHNDKFYYDKTVALNPPYGSTLSETSFIKLLRIVPKEMNYWQKFRFPRMEMEMGESRSRNVRWPRESRRWPGRR